MRKRFPIFISLLWIFITGCGISSSGMPGPGKVTLWDDVPEFPGASQNFPQSAVTAFSNIFGQSGKMVSESFLYYSDKTPEDVVAFYSDDAMGKLGWKPNFQGRGKVGCVLVKDSANGESRANCVFEKPDDELTLYMRQEQNPKRVRILYQKLIGSLKSNE